MKLFTQNSSASDTGFGFSPSKATGPILHVFTVPFVLLKLKKIIVQKRKKLLLN